MGEQALKDHFAGLAMQSLVATYSAKVPFGQILPREAIANESYEIADAMLKEREKKEDGGGDE